MSNEENQKKLSQLVKRAWADEKLKERLLNDPTPLLRENGIEIPAGVEARVVADIDSVSFLIQPQKSTGDVTELTASDLSSVVGGTKGGQPVEYLKVSLQEVLISSV
jgi:hypothetical protein